MNGVVTKEGSLNQINITKSTKNPYKIPIILKINGIKCSLFSMIGIMGLVAEVLMYIYIQTNLFIWFLNYLLTC